MDKFFGEQCGSHFDALKHLDLSYRHNTSNVFALGKPSVGDTDTLLNEDSEVHALQQIINRPRKVEVYSRVMFRNILLHSSQWNNKGVMKQNNVTVAYMRSGNIVIKRFVVVSNGKHQHRQ